MINIQNYIAVNYFSDHAVILHKGYFGFFIEVTLFLFVYA